MLVVCHFPICDARPFAAVPSLASSIWELPTPGSSFVRCFGPIEERRRGALEVFPDEIYYSSAQRAFKFVELERHALGKAPAALRSRCAFRRLLCSGPAVVRLEVGLASQRLSHRESPLTAAQVMATSLDILELPVQVSRFRANPVPSALWAAGKHVAHLYREATTAIEDQVAAGGPRLVVPCEPLLLIEYTQKELEALPQGAQAVDPKQTGGADLSYLRFEYRRRQFGIWFLRRDSVELPMARRLRLGLLRLHAEQQVLRATLSMLSKGEFQYVPRSESGERLDKYLNKSTRLLSLEKHAGFSPAAIQEVTAAYQLVANPAQRELLREKLEQVKRQIRLKVEAQIAPGQLPPAAPVVEKGDVVRVFVSYSHSDAKYLKPSSLLGYLSGLRKEGFDFWSDERIMTSEPWDDKIREEIRRADVALVLVSQAFLNSRYCQEIEIVSFLQESRQRGLRIYPIILSPCTWESHPWLAGTQFKPRQGTFEENYYRPEGKRKRFFLEIYEEFQALGIEIRSERQ